MTALSEPVARVAPRLVEWRRHFHRYPELSFEEHETTEFILERLQQWNLSTSRPLATGVVAGLKGNAPGRTVAIRADIDALPIQEKRDIPYRSVYDGRMHACGHDAHAAILLGVTRVLTEMKKEGELPGSYRLIFQPGEERVPGGASALVDAGVMEGVDQVIGLHTWTPLPVGKVWVGSGVVTAQADEFSIRLLGPGGHGSEPHTAPDALVAAAQLVVDLQTIVSRQIEPREPAVVTVGTLEAGDNFNVIAPEARLTGTVRTFQPDIQRQIKRAIDKIVRSRCEQTGLEFDLEYTDGYPPLENHEKTCNVIRQSVGEVLGDEALVDREPIMGGEDFAFYLRHVPGAFFFLGTGNPDQGIDGSHHQGQFDIDEEALPFGVEILVKSALKLARLRPAS